METILPKEIYALISTFSDEEDNFFRQLAGNFIIKEVRNDNTYANGLLHSFNDMPSVINSCYAYENNILVKIYSDGTQQWHQNGKLHRDGDKPAEICADGTQCWYQNGKLHRDGDKPAIICTDGTQYWYQNGERHRDGDKPAFITMNSSCCYKNGKLYNAIWSYDLNISKMGQG